MTNSILYKNIERNLFFLITVLNSFIILFNERFISFDGVAHVYNATIINDLILKNSDLKTVFLLNTEVIPNWIGHFFIFLFKIFFNGQLAEKILLVFYFILLPISFRYLLKQISASSTILAFFIIPFTITFPLIMGFYNYLISIVLMFFIIAYYVKHSASFKNKQVILLAIFLLLCYFSHLFSFITTIIVISVYSFSVDIQQKFNEQKIVHIIKSQLLILLISIIPLILTLLFFYKRTSDNTQDVFLSMKQLMEELRQFRVLITYDFEKDLKFVNIISTALCSLFVITLYLYHDGFRYKVLYVKQNLFNLKNIWLFLLCFYLALYFKMPDISNNAGYINMRLSLMIYILLIIILSFVELNKTIIIVALVITGFAHVFRLSNVYKVQKELNKIVLELNIVEKSIPCYSSIYPINKSDNWLLQHISNVLGANKPLIIFDNYEASTGYFPVLWNKKDMPNWFLGDYEMNVSAEKGKIKKQIDYVLLNISINKFNINDKFDFKLFKYYKPIIATKNFILFKHRNILNYF